MAKDEHKQKFSSLSGMVVFILVAALLWIVIKLSDTHTVTVPFAIHYVDIPASRLIADNDQEVKATVTTTGFKLLNYYFTNKKNRKIDISLKELKCKKIDDKVYSYSSRYIIDKIGDYLSSNTNDIQLTDDTQYFNMSRLASKKVKVVPETNFSFEQQYNYYGEPMATPGFVTIYGSVEDINNTKEVKTEVITRKNVNQNVVTKVKIDLDEKLRADIDEVEVSINVEKYTESEVVVPVEIPGDIKMHLFPEKVHIKYVVAMKDYAIINSMSFKATVDTMEMFFNDALPVDLVLFPNNTQIISIEPKEVDYIIIR